MRWIAGCPGSIVSQRRLGGSPSTCRSTRRLALALEVLRWGPSRYEQKLWIRDLVMDVAYLPA